MAAGPAHGAPPPNEIRVRPFSEVLSEDAVWAIVEGAPDGILMVDQDGRLVLVNRRLEEMFGYERGELLGQAVEILIPEEVRDVHVARRHRYRDAPRVREMGSGLDLSGRRRDGSTFPVEVSLSPVTTAEGRHSLAIIRDVTQRKESEEAVRRMQRLLDTSGEAVFLAHAETLDLVYVNEGATSLTGYDKRRLLAMSIRDLAPDVDEASLAAVLDAVLGDANESVQQQVTIRHAAGTGVRCDALLQRFDWGDHAWLAAFVRDATDRLRAEDEHRRAEHALALVDQQERIARDLHDTVIQSLFGIGMSLQAASVLAGGTPAVERITRSVADLDRAIRSLRATVFMLHEPSPVTGGLREEVAATVHEISRSLGFTPAVRFTGPVDYTVPDAVREHLIPCLREALANTAKHAEASRVEVDVEVGGEVGGIALRVCDDGVGIPAAVRRGEGLNNLELRAAVLGGSFSVARGPEGGTVVEWRVPVT